MEVLQERNRQDKSTFRAASPVAFVSMINELGNPVQPGRFQMEGDYAIAGPGNPSSLNGPPGHQPPGRRGGTQLGHHG